MKDDEFRDWRNDEPVPREPSEDTPEQPPSVAPEPASPWDEPDPRASMPAAGKAGSDPWGTPLQPQAIICPNCYQNLTGATIGSACPECGLVVGAGVAGSMANRPTSGKAVAAMVLGIISIVGCVFYGVPSMVCGPLALIFARQAKGQVLRNEVSASSQGMATAGFVCGLIGTIMAALVIGAILFVIVMAIASSS